MSTNSRIISVPIGKDSLERPEIQELLNRCLQSNIFVSPILNNKLGQMEPPAEYKRAGQLAYADGTNWDPASTGKAGLYIYTGSEWQKVWEIV